MYLLEVAPLFVIPHLSSPTTVHLPINNDIYHQDFPHMLATIMCMSEYREEKSIESCPVCAQCLVTHPDLLRFIGL